MRKSTTFALLVTMAGAAHASEAQADLHKGVDAALISLSVDSPGCAVGVSLNGRVDYAKGIGTADLSHAVRITPRSAFHAASISKQFTAFSIGLLETQDKLSYEDRVRKYVPELPAVMDAITIDQLIHHTNGIREQGQLLNLAGWRTTDLQSEADIMWALSRQRQLNFEPGTEVVYGNSAYTLLAIIVHRVSGRTLSQFAAEEIFAPLGMASTRFSQGYHEIGTHQALSYARAGTGVWQHAPLNISHYGSTGLVTTVEDLLRWQQNLLDGRVGGKRLSALMRTSGRLKDGTPVEYGHGLRLRNYRGLPLISHDGVDAGFRSETLLFPNDGLAIAVLCNGAELNASGIARKIADLYLSSKVKEPALRPQVAVAPDKQSPLAGTYWSEQTDELLDVKWDGKSLVAGGVELVPTGENMFRPQSQPNEWRFTTQNNGAQMLSVRDSWPTWRNFEKLSQPLPGAQAQAALVGSYHSSETATSYAVSLVDNQLRLRWQRGYDLVLTAVGGNRFSSARGTVTFARGRDGRVASLMISNRRLRRLTAVRIGP